jgi:hypothetical protein
MTDGTTVLNGIQQGNPSIFRLSANRPHNLPLLHPLTIAIPGPLGRGQTTVDRNQGGYFRQYFKFRTAGLGFESFEERLCVCITLVYDSRILSRLFRYSLEFPRVFGGFGVWRMRVTDSISGPMIDTLATISGSSLPDDDGSSRRSTGVAPVRSGLNRVGIAGRRG